MSSTEIVAVRRIESLVDLERSGALTRTGLTLPNTITYEQYEALGGMLGEVHEAICWAVGDWLNAGEDLFSEQDSQAAEMLDLSEEQRLQYGRVARRFDRGSRRRELTFSHHRVVASMKDVRARDELLEKAVVNKWTTRDLETAKKNPPVGELPEPSLDWRYRTLRKAADRVWNTKDMTAGGMYAIPAVVIDELGVALDKA